MTDQLDGLVIDCRADDRHKGYIKLTVHVAHENAPLAANLIGFPTKQNPVAISIVRKAEQPAAVIEEAKPKSLLARNAAILCADPVFQAFLRECREGKFLNVQVNDAESAALMVRYLCRVKSRAEIIEGTPAADRWLAFHARFIAWKEHDLPADPDGSLEP